MALSEREWTFSAAGLGWIVPLFAAQHRTLEGPARLIFADGREAAATATLSVSQSMFSSWGEGHLWCGEAHGLDAFDNEDCLSLEISGEAPVTIQVYAVKVQDGKCRCSFEVKS
jgi:hypothetical protein